MTPELTSRETSPRRSGRYPPGDRDYTYPDGTPCPYSPGDCGDLGTWDAVLNGDYP